MPGSIRFEVNDLSDFTLVSMLLYVLKESVDHKITLVLNHAFKEGIRLFNWDYMVLTVKLGKNN